MIADKRGEGKKFWAPGLLAAAFGILLLMLHGAQPLAVTGPILSPSAFTAVKNARYRIVLPGRIDQPVSLSFQTASEEAISSEIVAQPREQRIDATEVKILKAHASAAEAGLVIQGNFEGRLELRAIDEHAPLRKWLAALLFWCCSVGSVTTIGVKGGFRLSLWAADISCFFSRGSSCLLRILERLPLLRPHQHELARGSKLER